MNPLNHLTNHLTTYRPIPAHFFPASMPRPSSLLPWEFEPEHACRSVLPLYLLYGGPLWLLQRVWTMVDGGAASGGGGGGGIPVLPWYPWLVWWTVRVVAVVQSLVVDWVFFRIQQKQQTQQHNNNSSQSYYNYYWLYALSYTTLTYLVRPFSNTTETAVVALCTLCTWKILHLDQQSPNSDHNQSSSSNDRLALALGALCAFGCFTRMTFPAFGAPLVLVAWYHAWRAGLSGGRGPSGHRKALSFGGNFLAGACVVTVVGMVVDSVYFGRVRLDALWDLFSSSDTTNATDATNRWWRWLCSVWQQRWTLTPWNNLMYNLDARNLARHGLHARWTHVVVNVPLLFGPTLLLLPWAWKRRSVAAAAATTAATAAKEEDPRWLLLSPVCGVLCLSVMPHQEARFLLPATVGLHLFLMRSAVAGLVGSSGTTKTKLTTTNKSNKSKATTKPKLTTKTKATTTTITTTTTTTTMATTGRHVFRASFFVFHVVLTVLFGFLHQGGVIPCLLENQPALRHASSLFFWKVYPPPTVLLARGSHPPPPSILHVTDMSGWSRADVERGIQQLQMQQRQQRRRQQQQQPLGDPLPASTSNDGNYDYNTDDNTNDTDDATLLLVPNWMASPGWRLVSDCPTSTTSAASILGLGAIPHVGLDDLGEFVRALRRVLGAGGEGSMRDLSLGLYQVPPASIPSTEV